jgi:hypothetical protein
MKPFLHDRIFNSEIAENPKQVCKRQYDGVETTIRGMQNVGGDREWLEILDAVSHSNKCVSI